jgi:hypothetical protein
MEHSQRKSVTLMRESIIFRMLIKVNMLNVKKIIDLVATTQTYTELPADMMINMAMNEMLTKPTEL